MALLIVVVLMITFGQYWLTSSESYVFRSHMILVFIDACFNCDVGCVYIEFIFVRNISHIFRVQ